MLQHDHQEAVHYTEHTLIVHVRIIRHIEDFEVIHHYFLICSIPDRYKFYTPEMSSLTVHQLISCRRSPI